MTQTIFPALHYRDPEAALRLLTDAFDAREHGVFRDDAGHIQHAELQIAGGLVMFGGTAAVTATTDGAPAPITLYVVVSDPDAHCERASSAGARIIREPQDMPYGSREYGAEDLEGNRWSFGTYDPNDPPA